MPSEFKSLTLGDFADVIGGGTPPTNDPDNYNGEIPWITPKDLSNHQFRYIERGERNITRRGLEKSSAKIIPENSVLFTSRAPIGYIAIAKNPVSTNQGFKSLVLKDGNDPGFFYYLLKFYTEKIESFATGSTFKEVSGSALRSIEVSVPSYKTQRRIAEILGTLDEKIELNQKMNQTLEDIAKAIFKSWFVDFDPVRAKAEGRPTGLPAEISALFPDAFEDSEMGEIPAGWALKTIGDIADCVGGGTPSTKSPEFWDNGIHAWTTPKDLSNSRSIHLMQTDRKITDLGLKKISSGLLPAGTVLLSSRAPVGYLALATEPTAINQGYIALRPKGAVSNFYLLQWCDANLSEIKSRASGTTFAEISKASFRPIPALAPHDDVMSAFHRIVSPIYERVHISSKETQLLEDLRDTLLPKLISGELRIPDAEKFLEEVGV